MQQSIQISTSSHNGLYDITRQVEGIVAESAEGGPAWLMFMYRAPLQGS